MLSVVADLLCIAPRARPKMTALMGSSGAGKTTLLDVLAGRKTGGTTTGDIRLNGHPKLQKTFTRQSVLFCFPPFTLIEY